MRTIKIEAKAHNTEEMAREVEHISTLVMDGHISGDKWELTGEDESEPVGVNELEAGDELLNNVLS